MNNMPCHPERSEGPMHSLGGLNSIDLFSKLRAGSSRKERAQDDERKIAGATR
jgi:hypothetical protein